MDILPLRKLPQSPSVAGLTPLSWSTTIRSIAEGLVDVEAMVTHTYPLEETEKAIVSLRSRTDNPMKVQITP
jgi:threonine dehydrogenase-like Zn-dependent dehydrogenase